MSEQSTPWTHPGALTPVAPSPLPFPDSSSTVISLPRSPNSTPISPEPTIHDDFELDRSVDVPSVSLLSNRVAPSASSTTLPGTLQPVSLAMLPSPPLVRSLPQSSLQPPKLSSPQTTSPQIPSSPQFPSVSPSPRPPQITSPQFPSVSPSPRPPQITSPQFHSVSSSPRPPQITTITPSVSPSSPQFPSVSPSSQTTSPQFPSVSPSPQITSPQFPSITPSSQPQSSLVTPSTLIPVSRSRRQVTNRSISRVSRLGSINPVVTTFLADNETGDLRWNRPDRPEPENGNSSYRRIGCIGDGSCFFHAVSKGLSEVYQMSYRDATTVTEAVLMRLESSINYAIRFPSELFDKPRSNDTTTIYQIRRPPYYQSDMGPVFLNLLYQFRIAYARHLRQDFANNIIRDSRMDQIIRDRFVGSIELEQQTIQTNAEQQLLLGIKPPSELDVYEQAVRVVKDRLVQELLSGNPVQPDFMLALSDFVNVDIYLLNDGYLSNPDPRTNPLYGGSSLHEAVHGPIDMRPAEDRYRESPNRRAIVLISVNDIHYEIVGRVDETQGSTGVSLHVHPNLSQSEPLIRQLYTMLRDTRAR